MKKYILLDRKSITKINDNEEKNIINMVIPKLVTGFTNDDISDVFNIQQNWTPGENEKLYFLPGCTVPRFKVREKFSCTIKPTNATTIFIPKNNLEFSDSGFDGFKNCYQIENNSAEKGRLLHFMKSQNVPQMGISYENLIKSNPNANILLSGNLLSYGLWHNSYSIESLHYVIDKYSFDAKTLYCYSTNSEMKNITCPIYFEEEILNILNEDKLNITETKYQELRAFGLTMDDENLMLMMELMANSNFEKSVGYLTLLLFEFKNNIPYLKNCDHVNFKSLLTYLGLTRSDLVNHKFTFNETENLLRKHKKFTKSNAMILASIQHTKDRGYDESDDIWQDGKVIRLDKLNELDND